MRKISRCKNSSAGIGLRQMTRLQKCDPAFPEAAFHMIVMNPRGLGFEPGSTPRAGEVGSRIRMGRSAVSYIEKHLIAGESVVYKTRLHWVVLVIPILLGAVIAVPGFALLLQYEMGAKNQSAAAMAIAGAVLLCVAAIIIVRGFLIRNATEMTVTNMRIVVKVGVAARRTVEMLLSRVESIGVEESVAGRMLGYGTVIVRGTGGTPESFDDIAHPLEFRTQVQGQIEKTK
jgi:uncharacterized membrane protein YdbT with pleckstrin-like domain